MKKKGIKIKEIDVGEISLHQLKKEDPREGKLELSLTDSTFSAFNICILLMAGILIAGLFS